MAADMRQDPLMNADRALLLVVDIQERLLPSIHDGHGIVTTTRLLAQAARRLGVPMLVSEQYPRGLGPTVDALADALAGAERFEKVHFSCALAPGFLDRLAAFGRRELVIVGMEAHICVLQTTLGLRAAGWPCFVVADAVGSRVPANAELALARMTAAGATVVSTEMVVFEWLRQAGTPAFKEISQWVK